MNISHPLVRELAWNGLCSVIPMTWEAIVSGHCHLMLENDFQPVLELRWQPHKKTGRPLSPERFLKRLGRELGRPVVEVPLPQAWHPLGQRYRTLPLSWNDDHRTDGVLCFCPDCSTVIFCRTHTHQHTTADDIAHCLNNLQCHRPKESMTRWTIQDFSLLMPNGFQLVNSTFAAGLSRLAFVREKLHVQTCRLASASDRLAASSLEDILGSLHGHRDLSYLASKDGLSHECWSAPSVGRQLRLRLARQKPFVWSRIWHRKREDRLLAVLLESIHPIPLDIAHTICEHYEIVPYR